MTSDEWNAAVLGEHMKELIARVKELEAERDGLGARMPCGHRRRFFFAAGDGSYCTECLADAAVKGLEAERDAERSAHDLTTRACEAWRKDFDAATQRAERLEGALDRATDLLMCAWGVIANVGGGNWMGEQPVWIGAAEKWRDDFHAALRDRAALSSTPPAAKCWCQHEAGDSPCPMHGMDEEPTPSEPKEGV